MYFWWKNVWLIHQWILDQVRNYGWHEKYGSLNEMRLWIMILKIFNNRYKYSGIFLACKVWFFFMKICWRWSKYIFFHTSSQSYILMIFSYTPKYNGSNVCFVDLDIYVWIIHSKIFLWKNFWFVRCLMKYPVNSFQDWHIIISALIFMPIYLYLQLKNF